MFSYEKSRPFNKDFTNEQMKNTIPLEYLMKVFLVSRPEG